MPNLGFQFPILLHIFFISGNQIQSPEFLNPKWNKAKLLGWALLSQNPTNTVTEVSTSTNLLSNRFVQTQPMQYAEAGTNTNLPRNRFAQTQQMQYAEAGTN